MKDPDRKPGPGLLAVIVIAALAAGAAYGAPEGPALMTGLTAEYLSRTVTWEGDEAVSKAAGPIVSLRQDFLFRGGWTVSLSAGLSLLAPDRLVFRELPVSVEYDSGALLGVAVGAEIRVPILRTGDVEIRGFGRAASSFGTARSWELEGFAVTGEARGRMRWSEVAVGPEAVYRVSGKFIPSLEIFASWLWADFKMDETLGDLTGSETRRVKADLALGASLGADFVLSERLTLTARAGMMPYEGGVDALASAGIRIVF